MRIIVSDTSCMIDLRKASLLREVLALPFSFIMPNTLFEDEWLDLSEDERRELRQRGLEVRDLPGPVVERAMRYFNQHRKLKLNDCFALCLAEENADSILLTGDGTLRQIGAGKGIEVRGVLWVIDELENHGSVPLRRLYEVLQLFRDDDLIFLPADEVQRRLRRIAQLL
ncbi:MAG: PIN domain-containing protein [Alphaproteobacteria bacterium]